jgi:hypothetical protein
MPPNSAPSIGHRLGRIRVADVDRHGQRGAALTVDPVGDLLGAVDVDVGDHHGRALAGERLGVGLADAAAPVTIATLSSNCPFLLLERRVVSTIRPDERN